MGLGHSGRGSNELKMKHCGRGERGRKVEPGAGKEESITLLLPGFLLRFYRICVGLQWQMLTIFL